MKHAWWEVKEVHPKRFYWYRRWREGSQTRSQYIGPAPSRNLAADLGIAMAVNPVDDPAVELNFPGDDSILIVNVAPGAAITTTQPATAKTTSITTNGVPAGNAASGREDVSSTPTHDQPALKEDTP